MSMWLQEFKHMPLRLSRQMLLDHWNEAIAFVSATLDARLASGNDDAGVPQVSCNYHRLRWEI